MSKEKLVENLTATNNLICQVEELNAEYEHYHRPFKLHTVFMFLGIGIMMVPMYHIVDFILGLGIIDFWLIQLVFVSSILFVPIIVIVISTLIINKTIRENRIKKNQARIYEIEDFIVQANHLLEVNSELPRMYWYSYASGSILAYIINRRADSLKESLNLYEVELRHQEQMNLMYVLRQDQIAIFNQVRNNRSAIRTSNILSWANLLSR